MQWEHGDFGLNAKHPPLAKFLATMPPLAMILTEPRSSISFTRCRRSGAARPSISRMTPTLS